MFVLRTRMGRRGLDAFGPWVDGESKVNEPASSVKFWKFLECRRFR